MMDIPQDGYLSIRDEPDGRRVAARARNDLGTLPAYGWLIPVVVAEGSSRHVIFESRR